MKIEIKLIRSQTAPSPRKKTLMRIAALLALLALVLAIPASAKYFDSGSAVFSTELDSVAYKVAAPITLTGGDTIGITRGMWMPDYSAVPQRVDAPDVNNPLEKTITAPITGFVSVYVNLTAYVDASDPILNRKDVGVIVAINGQNVTILRLLDGYNMYIRTPPLQIEQGDVIRVQPSPVDGSTGVLWCDGTSNRCYAMFYPPKFAAF